MDPWIFLIVTALFYLVIAAALFTVLYWVIRRAVAAGIHDVDARRARNPQEPSRSTPVDVP